MLVTASWGDAEVAVEVDAKCRSVAALKRCLQEALPELDVEVVRLKVGGRSLDNDEGVLGLSEGSVIDVSVTPAALAATTLREEGIVVSFKEFCRVAEAGDLRVCRLFLEVDVVWKPGVRNNPLHAAAKSHNRELLQLLLESGCPKDHQNSKGNTALHFALAKHNPDLGAICKLLLDAGCAPDVQNSDGNTPLHVAACRRDTQNCELLLEAGCANNVRNNQGNMPLHFAATRGCEPLCQLLLEAGCVVDVKNGDGDRPLDFAVKHSHTGVSKLLLDSGATPVKPKSSTAQCCVLS